jgi:DNA-binding transcriptional ArsR family regulator
MLHNPAYYATKNLPVTTDFSWRMWLLRIECHKRLLLILRAINMNEIINEKTRESIAAGLHELLKRLRAERDLLDAKIKQHETDLINLGDTTIGIKGKRRKYGLNRQLVEDFLKNNPDRISSVADIAKSANLPRSSVRAVLLKIKDKGKVEDFPDGTWKLKQLT